MKKHELKELMKEAIDEYVWSERFELRLGGIVQAVVNAKLDKEVTMTRFNKTTGQVLTEKRTENVLNLIAEIIPNLVGAFRGCQEDSNHTLNASIIVGAAALESLGHDHAKSKIVKILEHNKEKRQKRRLL